MQPLSPRRPITGRRRTRHLATRLFRFSQRYSSRLRPNDSALTSQVVADSVGHSLLVPVWSALLSMTSHECTADRQRQLTNTVGDNLAALDSALYIVIGHLRERSSDKHKQHARVRIKCKRLPSY